MIIIYIWTLKIIKDSRMYIGIDSSHKKYINADFSRAINLNHYYSFGGDTEIYYNNQQAEYNNNVFSWSNGSILNMKLNVKNKTLSYYSPQDANNIVLFTNINFEDKIFNLAISMGSNDCVQLIDFKQISID